MMMPPVGPLPKLFRVFFFCDLCTTTIRADSINKANIKSDNVIGSCCIRFFLPAGALFFFFLNQSGTPDSGHHTIARRKEERERDFSFRSLLGSPRFSSSSSSFSLVALVLRTESHMSESRYTDLITEAPPAQLMQIFGSRAQTDRERNKFNGPMTWWSFFFFFFSSSHL